MGKVRKIVNGRVVEVDDNQPVRTIENGVVVEKTFGDVKKKDGSEGFGDGFGPSPFDMPAQLEKPFVAVTKDGKKFGIQKSAVPLVYGKPEDVLKGVQERLAKGTPTFEDIDVIRRSNPTYTQEEVNAYVIGNRKVGDVQRMRNFIAKNNAEYGLDDREEDVLKDDISINNYIEKISGSFGTKKREQINAQIPIPAVPYQTFSASKAEDYIRMRSDLEQGASEEFKQLSKDYLAQLKEEGVRKVVANNELSKEEKIKRVNALVKGTKAERVLQSSIKQAEEDVLNNYFEDRGVVGSVLDFVTGRNVKKNLELLKSDRFDAEIVINNAIYKEAESLAAEMPNATPERKAEILSQIEALEPQLTDTKELMVKYPSRAQMLMAQGINDLKLSMDSNIEGNDEQGSFSKEQKDFASTYIGKNVIKGPMEGGAFNVNVANGDDAVAAVSFLQSQGYLSDPKLKPIADNLIRRIITGDISLKDPSILGGLGRSITGVFGGAVRGVGDILGLRTAADAHAENILERGFPTEAENMKFIPKTARNIVNTTGNVLGQAGLQLTGAGIARGVGVGAKLANSVGFWASGALPQFDDSYKQSIDIIENEAGRKLFALFNSGVAAATEKIFPESKVLDIPGVKNSFAEIAQRFSNGELTDAVYSELMGKAKNAAWQFAKDTGVNISKETVEETITKGAELASRVVAGDESVTWSSALNELKETAYQTATGTLLVGAMGAYSDAQRRRFNTNANVLYAAAQNNDEAHDAIMRKFDKDGDADARDLSLKTLNTSTDVLAELRSIKKQMGLNMSDGQEAMYVANKTAQLLLEEQKLSDKDSFVNKKIDEKIGELKKQEDGLLSGKLAVDENTGVIVDEIQPDPQQPSTETEDVVQPVTEEIGTSIVSESSVIEPAKPNVLLNKDNKDSFITNSGRQKVEFVDGGLKVYDTNSGEDVSRATSKKAVREFAESFDFSHGELSPEPPSGISNEIQLKNHIVETSNNPYEIAEVYVSEESTMQSLSVKERMIAEYGIGKVTGKSYNSFGDRNNMGYAKAKQYLSKTGESIDVVAKEMSDYYGNEISPSDIVSFMDRFPKGEGEALKEVEGDISVKAAVKFKELTGIDLNSEVAQKVIEKEFNKLNKEQQSIAEKDYETEQQLADDYWKQHEETDGFTKESVADKIEQREGEAKEINEPALPNERDVMIEDAAKLVDEGSIKTPVYDSVYREYAASEDKADFEQGLQEIAQQAGDPATREAAIRDFGEGLVDIAEKLFPNEKSKPLEIDNEGGGLDTQEKEAEAERADGLDKKQVDNILSALDKLKINPNALLALPPGIDLITGFTIGIWNGGIEVIKKSIQAGSFISDAIKNGISYIKDELAKDGNNLSTDDEKKISDYFTEQLAGTPESSTGDIKSIAKKIKNNEVKYSDVVEGKDEAFIAALKRELYGSEKFSPDEDAFRESVIKQKVFGLGKQEIKDSFNSVKKLTKKQVQVIDEIFASSEKNDKAAAELQQAFDDVAKGAKPKKVLQRLAKSDVAELVSALKNSLTYNAVSNKQLEDIADYIMEITEPDDYQSYLNGMYDSNLVDVKQILRAKMIISLQESGDKEAAKKMVEDMADEATVSGRQTQSLKKAYEILNAKGDAATRTAFSVKFAEAVRQRALAETQRISEVLTQKEAEIGRLNERIHKKTQGSGVFNKIKEIIAKLCGTRNK